MDAPLDAVPQPDAKPCVVGFVDLCTGITVRPEALTIADTVEINSGTDPRCQVKAQTGGGDACVLYFTSISIPTGATLLLHGSRPVVLASATTVTIAGTLDISSRRSRLDRNGAGSGTCNATTIPQNDIGGAGGGAGGSFASKGGDGGNGDTNLNGGNDGLGLGGTAGALVAQPTVLRGGCNGQTGGNGDAAAPGTGGPSGGAIYLFAKGAIDISGRVLASGSGGGGGDDSSGGGGGGSGGMIVIESEVQSAISGLLLSTGGGGGEGGESVIGGVGAEPTSPTAAAGGSGSDAGGNGGPGATQSGANLVAAGNGEEQAGGGGGGGGGNGFIILRGAGRQISGMTAPMPILPPGT